MVLPNKYRIQSYYRTVRFDFSKILGEPCYKLCKRSAKGLSNDAYAMFFFSGFLYKSIYCGYSFELHRLVDAIQISIHNICFYKEVDKKYTGCNLKTTELLDCALIVVCAIIRSNTVCCVPRVCRCHPYFDLWHFYNIVLDLRVCPEYTYIFQPVWELRIAHVFGDMQKCFTQVSELWPVSILFRTSLTIIFLSISTDLLTVTTLSVNSADEQLVVFCWKFYAEF